MQFTLGWAGGMAAVMPRSTVGWVWVLLPQAFSLAMEERASASMSRGCSTHQPHLPSRQQLAGLRDFVHGRTYSAAWVAVRPDGAPPHAEGSPLDDVGKVADALYEVVNALGRPVPDAVHSGQPNEEACDSWVALLLIARHWRDSPDLPANLKALVDGALPL
ncbi:hypothetical protein ACIRBX_33915 [Kitasatospora sp. NPDC096147]|uniref:hypothetical protein n=1 Tax=Kitasatospora sp. NPDC096147 TaxID=3364093 RepID=UPI003827F818